MNKFSMYKPVNCQDPVFQKKLKKRYAAERRFKNYSLMAVGFALFILSFLCYSITSKGYSAFFQTHIELPIFFDPEVLQPYVTSDPNDLKQADYQALIRESLGKKFPSVTEYRQLRSLMGLISPGAEFDLQKQVISEHELIGQTRTQWILASDEADMFYKGHDYESFKEDQKSFLTQLDKKGLVERKFNFRFFTHGDSRNAEMAGILSSAIGSFFTLLITLIISFPIGILSAIYLEEFAPKNKWTHFIELNINNLAAVPSIVFGLLGLELFLNVMHLPRSAPIVGGLTLALMTLPTLIISSRAALKSVPMSIRAAALGLGASQMQSVTHHVLPLAMPGILTGTIIGMSQALGETAPLLMIGMVAFIVTVPQSVFDPSSALPVQIYLWADHPERAFVEKTSAAIMVLLAFLMTMNALAIFLRRKFEHKW